MALSLASEGIDGLPCHKANTSLHSCGQAPAPLTVEGGLILRLLPSGRRTELIFLRKAISSWLASGLWESSHRLLVEAKASYGRNLGRGAWECLSSQLVSALRWVQEQYEGDELTARKLIRSRVSTFFKTYDRKALRYELLDERSRDEASLSDHALSRYLEEQRRNCGFSSSAVLAAGTSLALPLKNSVLRPNSSFSQQFVASRAS